MQKVQAVNVDLSSFTDPNANPTLHQMVAQMISDKVVVTANEKDQPAADAAAAAPIAGFPVQLLSARKDAPKARGGRTARRDAHVDRARLQAIFTEAGHPELSVPQSLDGADRLGANSASRPSAVRNLPRSGQRHRGLASNITGPDAGLDAVQRLRALARRAEPRW